MNVVKRNGSTQPVSFDKVLHRINNLASNLDRVNVALVAQKTISGLRDGVHTSELDKLAAETAAYMVTEHPQYSVLAARIELSNLAKQTCSVFSQAAHRSNLSSTALDFIDKHADRLDAEIDHSRDDGYDYFSVRTLFKSYLRRDPDAHSIAERPQYCLMRIAVGIHCADDDVDACIKTYHALSLGQVSHATPTMFNSGTAFPQMASCFLMQMPEDSIDGIFDAAKWCARISKYAGGIGLDVTKIRARGSTIRGSDGTSNGLGPMLQVFDRIARYVDQGGGKRKGAIAIYVEVWHPDVVEVLDMKKNHGKEEMKARDLFYGLWTCDLFMQRVDADEEWSFFCPDACPDLLDLYGDAFDERYAQHERDGKAMRTCKARWLWALIIDAQIETGTPYLLFKDSCNRKSMHQHLGPLRCSNLCTEILEYVSKDEIAVCNLASIALPRCVHEGSMDYEALEQATRLLVRNLNKIIDHGFYPLEETMRSNLRHRPIGIGVQGLADVFLKLRIPFEGERAREINRNIFETMYYAALSESVRLAMVDGPFPSYSAASTKGAFPILCDSPLAQGKIQPDLWAHATTQERHDWDGLRADLVKYGARNSLLLAPMPTASTAQILGNTECFEPITSNLYSRRVLSGEFPVVNKELVSVLEECGAWNDETRQTIIRDNGSVQNVDALSDELKAVFKTVWEMKMRNIIDMAADRGVWIDQSQSLNLFIGNANHAKLTAMHMYAWKKGLKTGQYYLRTQAGADAAKVSVCAIGCSSCSA